MVIFGGNFKNNKWVQKYLETETLVSRGGKGVKENKFAEFLGILGGREYTWML